MDEKNSIEIPDYLKDLIQDGQSIDEIKLDEDGKWFHNDVEFSNKKIIDFFNKSIAKTSEGKYVLHYDKYTFPIVVEDAPLFVTGVIFEGFGNFEKIFLNISSGDKVELDPESLFVKTNNALYCYIGKDKFLAKFKRSPSFHILERLDEKNNKFYLHLYGKTFLLKQEK